MRLSFPNKEHDDTLIGAGDTRIGAAADNTIVLDHRGVAPHHVILSTNERGIVLTVVDAARTHVNTRPVREKAILRMGDVISIDTLQFVLKPARDDSIRTELPPFDPQAPLAPMVDANASPRINVPKVLLRGVSGTRFFGKIVPVRGKLIIGTGANSDLILDEPNMESRHAAIENAGDAIFLRDFGSKLGTWVNGVHVHDAILRSGDQIAFERNRFVLEAPGLPARNETAFGVSPQMSEAKNTQTMDVIRSSNDAAAAAAASDDDDRGNKNDIWWLIAAAALIAAGLALLFLVPV